MAVYMYGPNGEAQVFEKAKDAPAGWSDTPAKFGGVSRVVTDGGSVQTAVIDIPAAPEPKAPKK